MNKIDAVKAISDLYLPAIEASLGELYARFGDSIPPRLLESMTYSLLAGGKRLRPVLCLYTAEKFGVSKDDAMPLAVAIEFIHTASLIHDDLPCMDNDDLRRGKPTNHKVFGECMAVLAGDSLMIWAFGYALAGLTQNGISSERALAAAAYLSEAAGPLGMCGGQVLDTDPESFEPGEDFVYKITGKKTAALIRASVACGALLGGAARSEIVCLEEYGFRLGRAFQMADDILDATGTSEQLGKTPHKDEEQGKTTFVTAFGLESARRRAEEESAIAAELVSRLWGEQDMLVLLARQLVNRIN